MKSLQSCLTKTFSTLSPVWLTTSALNVMWWEDM